MLKHLSIFLAIAAVLLALVAGSFWYVVVRPQQEYLDLNASRQSQQAENSAIARYQWSFAKQVHDFAIRNRIDQGVLHRDKHADCYIRIVMDATIDQHGEAIAVSVAKSSGVPVVDRYYTYVIEQAAPYAPLSSEFTDGRKSTSIRQEFSLDARLYDDNRRSQRPCDAL